jgi:hypothetical protein
METAQNAVKTEKEEKERKERAFSRILKVGGQKHAPHP